MAQDYEIKFKEILKQYLRMKYSYKKQFLATKQQDPEYVALGEAQHYYAKVQNHHSIKQLVGKIAAINGLETSNSEDIGAFVH